MNKGIQSFKSPFMLSFSQVECVLTLNNKETPEDMADLLECAVQHMEQV